jgi:hypothetical protein
MQHHPTEPLEDVDEQRRQAAERAIIAALLLPLHDPIWSIEELQAECDDQPPLAFEHALETLKALEVIKLRGDFVSLTGAARRMADLQAEI